MDEKPNRFIMNNEKPLDDNGFSSIDNHQENIDNLDDSSKNENKKLQNDQGNQLNNKVDNKFINKNMPRNTNPNMNSKMDMAKRKIGQNATRAGLDAATGGAYEGVRKIPLVGGVAKKIEEKAGDKLSDKINNFRHPVKSMFGLNKNKENKESSDSVDVISSAKKIGKIASIGGTIFTVFSPIIILIIVIVVLVTPIVSLFTGVKDFVTDLSERFTNMFIYKSFSSNEELVEEFYKKVDTIVNFYPEISREGLIGTVYYTDIDPEEYLDSLDKDTDLEDANSNSEDDINFIRMRNKVLSLSNQMVYSTVTFRNDLIKVDDYNKKGEIIGHHYECPSGTRSFSSDDTGFCNGDVAKEDYVGSPDLRSADTCIDMTSPREDDETLKCYEIAFETNTERSKEKLENFLRYGIIADTLLPEVSIFEGYSWGNMVSKFSSLSSFSDSTLYNIPAYKIGKGKEIDNYTNLDNEYKRTVDNKIRVIMGLIEVAKGERDKDNNHIKGDATLPLDFVIKSTAEETINSRITSKFGYRPHPVYGDIRFHSGVDFSHITTSDPVYSLLDGVVVSVTNANTGCGIGALIGHDTNMDMKYDYYTRYCHFSSINVSVNQVVYNGQRIGTMGNTGTSTGIHLHFEIQDENNKPMDPVPYLIDIVNNSSALKSGPKVITDLDGNLKEKYDNLMVGNYRKRKGTIITANFSVDNISTLPYFCGGYTKNLIDNNWFTDKIVTNSSCPNYNQTSKYGLDTEGYVSWVLTQVGIINKRYSINELKGLGENVDIFDSRVSEGDLAYKNDKIGIITNIDDNNATIIYMDTGGLKKEKINRKLTLPLFDKVVLMDKIYE